MVKYRWVLQWPLAGLAVVSLSGCMQPMAASQPDSAASAPQRMLSMGSSDADKWLQVQREGSQASATPQRLSAQERELANQRWLDSFTHPIPEFYERDAGGGFGQD